VCDTVIVVSLPVVSMAMEGSTLNMQDHLNSRGVEGF